MNLSAWKKPAFKLSKLEAFLLGMAVSGILLRFYSLLFFEFKDDQALAVIAGPEVFRRGFMISHGMMSGVGIPNPPGFYWAMGLFSIVAASPPAFAFIFALCSAAAVIAWLFLMKDILPREENLCAAAILSLLPPLILYSSNIWAQSLMPLFSVSVFCLAVRFLMSGEEKCWMLALWASAVAASVHMSGFFLLPFVICCAALKRIRLKTLLLGVLPVILLFLPYAVFMLRSDGMRHLSAGRPEFLSNSIETVSNLADFYSCSFYKYYFRSDLTKVNGWIFGPAGAAASAACSLIMKAALFAGIALLIAGLVRRNKAEKAVEDCGSMIPGLDDGEKDLAYRTAAMQILTIAAGYIVLGIKTYPHYFLISLPSGAVIMTLAFRQIRHLGFLNLIFPALLVVVLAVNLSSLAFLDSAGGHPSEYGPHYGLIRSWGDEYAKSADENGRLPSLDILVSDRARGKFDADAILLGIRISSKGKSLDSSRKCRLLVDWNPDKMAYEYRWER